VFKEKVQLKTRKNGAEMRKESLTHYFGEMVSAKCFFSLKSNPLVNI
jgi:hypothetical protein